MDKNSVKIYYIYHSGFALETASSLLIFDYYKEPKTESESPLLPSLLNSKQIKENKKVFFFSSHSHGDHFNPDIFTFTKYNQEITYILSNDIKTNEIKSNFIFVEEGDEKEIDNIYIKVFGSTDIGVSYLISVDDLRIFHAGDLNWWHWKEDSISEQQEAEKNFKLQIDKLKEEKLIDIAFFPVDPRLEEFYYIGGQYFGEQLHPKLLIPMHFGDETWITDKFLKRMVNLDIRTVRIQNSLQEINY